MSTSIEAIEERLKKVLIERTSSPLSTEEIRSDIALVGSGLALDSVALLEFVVGVEEEFSLIIDDSALTVQQFESLRTLANFIRAELETQKSA